MEYAAFHVFFWYLLMSKLKSQTNRGMYTKSLLQHLDSESRLQIDALTCFLVMMGDLTGRMGETDSLVDGDTGL